MERCRLESGFVPVLVYILLGGAVMNITGHIYTTAEYGAKMLHLAVRLAKYLYHELAKQASQVKKLCC